MKYLLLLLSFPFMAATDCGKKQTKIPAVTGQEEINTNPLITDSVPPVVRKIIDSLAKDNPPLVPQKVEAYLYNGKTVYLVTMPCCDFFNDVYDTTGKKICSPTGGITGKGDGNCADFAEKGKWVKLLWKG